MSDEQQARIEELERQLDELRSRVERMAPVHEEVPLATSSRRDLLRLAAGAAAGGVAAVGLGATRAAALDGDNIRIGLTTTGTSLTEANCTGVTQGAAFLFQSGDVYDPPNADWPCALAGWTTTAQRPHGIYAFTTQAGHALVGIGAGAQSSGLRITGQKANAVLTPLGTAPPARTDAHELGEIVADTAGALWYCIAAGTPGTWRKLAGTGTSGAFHALTPFRAYDSRQAPYAPNNGVLAPNTSRVVSIKDARSTAGAIVTADAVPAGATAVTYNLTIASPTGPNFLAVTPGGATSFTASAINFNGTSDLANAATVAVDTSRQVKVWCGDQAGSTHFLIDITGYYL